jgi:hypothetical protein
MSDTSDFMPSQLNNMMDIQNMKKILDTTDQIIPQLKKVEFVEIEKLPIEEIISKPVEQIISKPVEQIIKPVTQSKCVEQLCVKTNDVVLPKQISGDLVKVFNIFVPKQTCGLTFVLIIIGLIIFYLSREPKKIDNNNL